MNDAPGEAHRAELSSKLLVIALVSIFIFGMLGFAVAVIDARNEPAPTDVPEPSLPAIPTLDEAVPAEGASRSRILLALAETSPAPSPSPEPNSLPSMGTSQDQTSPPIGSAPLVADAPTTMPVVPVVSFWRRMLQAPVDKQPSDL